MNRPCLLQHHSAVFNPPRLPETQEYEIIPEISRVVSTGSPTTGATPGQVMGPSGGVSYLLLRFDLRGFKEANIRFTSVGLFIPANQGTGLPAAMLHVGRINANGLTMTNSATYNTFDGASAWTGGAGGFLNAPAEISWTPAAMPGVVGGAIVAESALLGNYPQRGCYHAKSDTNIPATLATMLNNALDNDLDKVCIYVYTTTGIWQFGPGATITDPTDLGGVRLVTWAYTINPYLKWVGGDGGSMTGLTLGSREFTWPPLDVYASAGSAPSVNSWGYPYFDMTSVDPANVTFNWHGGTSSPTNFSNVITSAAGTGAADSGASTNSILMHFDLSSYIGRTFAKVRLRFHASRSGTTPRMYVAQCAQGWTPGNGGGAGSTSGPTWTLREKTGAVTWTAGTNVGAAAFIDVVGQAETLCTELNTGGATGFTTAYEADITAMVNRALTVYGGHLYLRVRLTHAAGGGARTIGGPSGRATVKVAFGAGYANHNTTTADVAVAGYRTWPHLRLREVDPTP